MIYFVGAGPGAADLITVRGARLLKAADVVVYAGSLVNTELLELCKQGCTVYNSAHMTLEQVIDVLVQADARGLSCVRLHTGDPALYGAHGEQMRALEECGIAFEVVPGVSSLFGAAAALKTELTVPEVTQSVVITRAEGRTPVPDAEQLRTFARHGCTIAIFLSASLLEKARQELLEGDCAPSTPAVIVVRATWPDEAVYRCTVETLAACAHEHNVHKTALVLVGEFLNVGATRSRLYDPGFSHEYRRAEDAAQVAEKPLREDGACS